MFRDLLLERCASFCQLSDEQIAQLQQHYNIMRLWNERINLTRIEGEAEAVERHYAESLFLGSVLPAGHLSIADVGSGPGFPGIPMAILRPDCTVTLIESHQRKAVFLKEATRGLKHVSVLVKRGEMVSQSFDWVVSRAVNWDELKKFAFRLAPQVAVLCTICPPESIKVRPLPWKSGGNVAFVSRETETVV